MNQILMWITLEINVILWVIRNSCCQIIAAIKFFVKNLSKMCAENFEIYTKSLTDALPICNSTGTGTATNQQYDENGETVSMKLLLWYFGNDILWSKD